MNSRTRIAGAVAGVAALMAIAGGVSWAAATAATSTTGGYATACVNSAHTLRLTDSKGACPAGYSAAKLGYAPTTLAISTLNTTKKTTVGGLTFTATCTNDDSGHYAELFLTSAQAYVVQGSDVVGGDPGFWNGTAFQAQVGAGQISLAAKAGATSSIYMLNDGGTTGDLIVIQSGHSIAVSFALFSYNSACSVQAQISPSG